jgi:hypothetical protein
VNRGTSLGGVEKLGAAAFVTTPPQDHQGPNTIIKDFPNTPPEEVARYKRAVWPSFQLELRGVSDDESEHFMDDGGLMYIIGETGILFNIISTSQADWNINTLCETHAA